VGVDTKDFANVVWNGELKRRVDVVGGVHAAVTPHDHVKVACLYICISLQSHSHNQPLFRSLSCPLLRVLMWRPLVWIWARRLIPTES